MTRSAERMVRGDIMAHVEVRAAETGQSVQEVALRHLLQLQLDPGVTAEVEAVWADACARLLGH